MIYEIPRWCIALALCLISSLAHAANEPRILYTDIVTGPSAGGEHNAGTYLSIFGKGFGNQLDRIKVFIGKKEVSHYIYLGKSKGRTDIQQLSVQPGPAVKTGKIKIIVGGKSHLSNIIFKPRKGDIYFISLDGKADGGQVNNVHKPFRFVQNVFNRADVGPGDTLVVRGGTWKDEGDYEAFLSLHRKSGNFFKPITIMAYPGEDVFIDSHHKRGGFNFFKTKGGFTISGFRVNSNGADLVQLQSNTNNMRVINNELYGLSKDSGGSAAISGNGHHWKLFGNNIHDNGKTKKFHGIYIDNDQGSGANNIEIAYNHVYNQVGGRGIQLYWKKPQITNISIHDNLIHDIDSDAIVVSKNTGKGITIYNNIIYLSGRTVGSGIRFYSDTAECKVFNNTFYNTNVSNRQAAVYVEEVAKLEFYNNIIYSLDNRDYFISDINLSNALIYNNLWYGAGTSPSSSINSINKSPAFFDSEKYDFRLTKNSGAIDASNQSRSLIQHDFNGNNRNLDGNGDGEKVIDLGAIEFTGHEK